MVDFNKIFDIENGVCEEVEVLINRCISIESRLEELDKKSTRPLRAILTGNGTDNDKQILKDIETEAKGLREELNTLIESNLTI